MNLAYLRNDRMVFVMIVGTPDMTMGTYIYKNAVSEGGKFPAFPQDHTFTC